MNLDSESIKKWFKFNFFENGMFALKMCPLGANAPFSIILQTTLNFKCSLDGCMLMSCLRSIWEMEQLLIKKSMSLFPQVFETKFKKILLFDRHFRIIKT